MQELKGAFEVLGPWNVIGHSWGAYLALLTAIEHPQSTNALVYIAGNGTPSWWSEEGSAVHKSERRRRMRVADLARLDDLSALERSWDEEVEFRRLSWMTDFVDQETPPEALDAMASTPLPINFPINRALSRAALYEDDELLARCERCTVPILFIHGSEDPRPDAGARLIADRMPNARFVRIADAGHLPWVEQPTRTRAVVTEFLRRVSPN